MKVNHSGAAFEAVWMSGPQSPVSASLTNHILMSFQLQAGESCVGHASVISGKAADFVPMAGQLAESDCDFPVFILIDPSVLTPLKYPSRPHLAKQHP